MTRVGGTLVAGIAPGHMKLFAPLGLHLSSPLCLRMGPGPCAGPWEQIPVATQPPQCGVCRPEAAWEGTVLVWRNPGQSPACGCSLQPRRFSFPISPGGGLANGRSARPPAASQGSRRGRCSASRAWGWMSREPCSQRTASTSPSQMPSRPVTGMSPVPPSGLWGTGQR